MRMGLMSHLLHERFPCLLDPVCIWFSLPSIRFLPCEFSLCHAVPMLISFILALQNFIGLSNF